MRRSLAVLAVATLLLGLVGGIARAQQDVFLDGKVRVGDQIVVPADETVESDLYVAAGETRIEGVVDGDLVVASGTVDIPGTVTGDVVVAAGDVRFGGTVEGDVRAAAGQVFVSGQVAEDVLATGGRLLVPGVIGTDLIFTGGQLTISGRVEGDVLATVGAYDRAGVVEGDEEVRIAEEAEEEQPNPLVIGLRRFAALLLVGLLTMWLFRRRLEAAVLAVPTNWAATLGWGLVVLAAIVVVPLLVLLVGIILAVIFGLVGLGSIVALDILTIVTVWMLIGLVAYTLATFLAPIVVAAWAGDALLPEGSAAYLALALGLAIYVVVLLVPILGALIGLAVFIVGAGAMLRSARERTAAPTAG